LPTSRIARRPALLLHGPRSFVTRQPGTGYQHCTHNFHPGSPPDDQSQIHAGRRGYDLSDLRARQIQSGEFDKFDLILVVDRDNLALVQEDAQRIISPRFDDSLSFV
jgi:hypothetical protein